MSGLRTARQLASLAPLRQIATPIPTRTAALTQVRFVNTDKEELGGVGGSEPPAPRRNPQSRKAAKITLAGVLIAGLWMWNSKAKENKA